MPSSTFMKKFDVDPLRRFNEGDLGLWVELGGLHRELYPIAFEGGAIFFEVFVYMESEMVGPILEPAFLSGAFPRALAPDNNSGPIEGDMDLGRSSDLGFVGQCPAQLIDEPLGDPIGFFANQVNMVERNARIAHKGSPNEAIRPR